MNRNPEMHQPQIRPGLLMLSGLLGAFALALGFAGPLSPASTVRAQDEPRSVLIRLPATNGADGYGRVKLVEQGDRTRVIVALHEGADGQFLPAIHAGTCATYPGEPIFPLAPFASDERSRTTVDMNFDDLTAGGYLVDIHPVAGNADELFDPKTSVACGEIPESQPVVEAQPTIAPVASSDEELIVTTAPVTGIGPVGGQYWSTITVAVLAALAIMFAVAGLDLRRRAIVTVAQRRLYQLTGRNL